MTRARLHPPMVGGLVWLRDALRDARYEFTPAEVGRLLLATGFPVIGHPGVCSGCGTISPLVLAGHNTPFGATYCPDCLVTRRMVRP